MALASLGAITVSSAGTKVRATVNQSDPGARYTVQSFQVQAGAANAGIIYIGFSNMNTSNGTGVLGIIPKPVSATTGPFGSQSFSIINSPAGIDMRDIYIDSSASGDIVYISVATQ